MVALATAVVMTAACTSADVAEDSATTVAGDAETVSTSTAPPEDDRPSTTTTTLEAPTTAEPSTSSSPAAEPVTVLAVADLADCRGPDAEVAELVRTLEGVILMPGDLAYSGGSQQQFDECWSPLYGSELDRIYAIPGDNDYNTPGAEPYFEVMSDRPGEPGKGWYVVDLGSWQLIALNSNCDEVGGCREDSEQYRWLDETLRAGSYECRIVMWHEPRFTSSANYSGIPRLEDFYGRVHGAGADILLVGHAHHYERLGPLAPNGRPDPGGITNFTVGIGGAPFTQFGDPLPGSQVRSNEHRGVIRFTLGDGNYDWEFVNVASNPTPLVDEGSADC